MKPLGHLANKLVFFMADYDKYVIYRKGIMISVENYIQYSHTQRSLGRRVAHDHRWPRELTDETIDS